MIKKILLTLGFCAALALVCECLYFHLIYRDQTNVLPACDAVLVYGGVYNRSVQGLALANRIKAPIFISDSFGGPKDVRKKIGSSRVAITVDHFGMTTDQNARNAVQYLKKGGYRKALLVTDWFHMPRALFLTRLYLLQENPHPTRNPLGPHPMGRGEDAKKDAFLINGKSGETTDSGISVEPYFYEPIPQNYWAHPVYWGELIRFWGSLGRVALAAVGFEKPWFHYFD
jgi:uncharacterized SAM-binding protein YcdF (DUF218 family)